MEWSSIMMTLLGVPLAILPQVIDTRYFFFVSKSTMHTGLKQLWVSLI